MSKQQEFMNSRARADLSGVLPLARIPLDIRLRNSTLPEDLKVKVPDVTQPNPANDGGIGEPDKPAADVGLSKTAKLVAVGVVVAVVAILVLRT